MNHILDPRSRFVRKKIFYKPLARVYEDRILVKSCLNWDINQTILFNSRTFIFIFKSFYLIFNPSLNLHYFLRLNCTLRYV